MGYFSAAELAAYLNADDDNVRDEHRAALNMRSLDRVPNINLPLCELVSVEWCQEWVDKLHATVIDGSFPEWKAYRPWTVVDLTASLDPEKAWIGWEVETGWETCEDRSGATAHILSTFDHVCADDEGCGWGVELTFSPDDGSKYAKQHPLLAVCALVPEWDAVHHYSKDTVGTHINVSTPTFRDKLDRNQKMQVMFTLNQMLVDCVDEWESLFGRAELYGGFFFQEKWLEGKLFNSTYDEATAASYIKVGNNIAKAMEQISENIHKHGWTETNCRVTNAYAVFANGEDCAFGGGSMDSLWGDDIFYREDDDYDGYDYEEEDDY